MSNIRSVLLIWVRLGSLIIVQFGGDFYYFSFSCFFYHMFGWIWFLGLVLISVTFSGKSLEMTLQYCVQKFYKIRNKEFMLVPARVQWIPDFSDSSRTVHTLFKSCSCSSHQLTNWTVKKLFTVLLTVCPSSRELTDPSNV